MAAALERALELARQVGKFDPALKYALFGPLENGHEELQSLAIRFTSAVRALPDEGLQSEAGNIVVDIAGLAASAGIALHASLSALADRLHDYVADYGDDIGAWPHQGPATSSPIEPSTTTGQLDRAEENFIENDPDLLTEIRSMKKLLDVPNAKRRNSYLTIILAMAKSKYGYDQSNKRNSATSAIKTDIELLGLRLDDDTIVSVLQEAANNLDFEPS